MPLPPEIKRLPCVLQEFHQSGLLKPVLWDTLFGKSGFVRNFSEDVARLAAVRSINISGKEHLPQSGGGLVVFNHPDIDVIPPAIASLAGALYEGGRSDLVFVMGYWLISFGFVGLGLDFGLEILSKRFTRLYPDNFIVVPTRASRKDYRQCRDRVKEEIVKRMSEGKLVALTPEGQIEADNIILPKKVFRHGSGYLARKASGLGLPIIPVAIWESGDKKIELAIGSAFRVEGTSNQEAVIQVMENIANLMPSHLRGPFNSQECKFFS